MKKPESIVVRIDKSKNPWGMEIIDPKPENRAEEKYLWGVAMEWIKANLKRMEKEIPNE